MGAGTGRSVLLECLGTELECAAAAAEFVRVGAAGLQALRTVESLLDSSVASIRGAAAVAAWAISRQSPRYGQRLSEAALNADVPSKIRVLATRILAGVGAPYTGALDVLAKDRDSYVSKAVAEPLR